MTERRKGKAGTLCKSLAGTSRAEFSSGFLQGKPKLCCLSSGDDPSSSEVCNYHSGSLHCNILQICATEINLTIARDEKKPQTPKQRIKVMTNSFKATFFLEVFKTGQHVLQPM